MQHQLTFVVLWLTAFGMGCISTDRAATTTDAGTDASLLSCTTDADCAAGEDGDVCNGTLRCLDGSCVLDPATVVSCAPPLGSDECTVPACDPATGACSSAPKLDGSACDDDNLCTAGDVCQNGACVGTVEITCAEQGPCVVVLCYPASGCTATPLPPGAFCDDSDPCTENGSCQDEVCVPDAFVCDCESDADCEAVDVDKCDDPLVCVDTLCVPSGGPGVTCEPSGDPCVLAQCDPTSGECEPTPAANGLSCADPTAPCSDGAVCVDGACRHDEGLCDDLNPCTVDTCDDIKGCGHVAVEGQVGCDDGDPCTAGEQCADGLCTGGDLLCECEKAADCLLPGSDLCAPAPECIGQKCVAGSGTGVICPQPPNACAKSTCDPSSGTCVESVVPEGTPCGTGDLCSGAASCVGGVCIPAVIDPCDDGNPCTEDSCDPSWGCTYAPLTGDACDDGTPCTTGDTCVTGTCDGDSEPAGSPCDDGDAATEADMCVLDVCRGFVTSAVESEDGGGYSFRLIGYGAGSWHIAADTSGDGDLVGVLLSMTSPDVISVHADTLGARYEGLHRRFAISETGQLWEYTGGGWNGAGLLGTALETSGAGPGTGLFSHSDGGNETLWAIGSDGAQSWLRRCVSGATAGDVDCQPQSLGGATSSSATPLAIAGKELCDALGSCSMHLALGADRPAGGGTYNDSFVNADGDSETWDLEFPDPATAATQTRDVAAIGNGRYIFVGSNGYLRHRDPNGQYAGWLTASPSQEQRDFTGAWSGAGVIVLSAWAPSQNEMSRDFELWTCPVDADITDTSSWTVHLLATATGVTAGLRDVWGLADGDIVAVGTGAGAGAAMAGLVYTRTP